MSHLPESSRIEGRWCACDRPPFAAAPVDKAPCNDQHHVHRLNSTALQSVTLRASFGDEKRVGIEDERERDKTPAMRWYAGPGRR